MSTVDDNGVSFPTADEARVLEQAARELEHHVVRVAIGDDKLSMLDAISGALEFPAYFGRNWDALADCLTDLSWLAARGYLFVFETSDRWGAETRGDLETLAEIAGEAAESWAERGVPFRCAIVVPEHSIVD